ncbi:hypothetical protein XBP1_1980029 [Xenorhabdus bovienii str. puntauvense]|nr:hypothetical protein XBP1_1980029 [Xenorhabdus bovienii str. puntauvense]
MLGFKNFRRVQTVLAGIELVCMLRKGQYRQKEGFCRINGTSGKLPGFCASSKRCP